MEQPKTVDERISEFSAICKHRRYGICWNENSKKYILSCKDEDYKECEDAEV